MPRNLSIIPARKTRSDRRLPLPDARRVLGPAWPGPIFWQAVLADPDWWWIYNLPPAKPHRLVEARHLHLITGVTVHTVDHSACPSPRPLVCDRYAPQAWHAPRHSPRCPHSPHRTPRVLRTEGSPIVTTGVPL